jgi:hypothetical protein
MDYNSISQSLIRAGDLSTTRLTSADASADRPAPQPMVLSTVPYTELNNWLDDNIPTGREFIWYFTLAKGFSPQATTSKYWLEKMTETINKCKYPVNIAFNTEYHSDEVTLHAHGLLWYNDEKTLKEFKRNLRKSFNIDSTNRCAIKYYQNNNKDHTAMDKIKYHLISTGYDNKPKSTNNNYYYYIKQSVASQTL